MLQQVLLYQDAMQATMQATAMLQQVQMMAGNPWATYNQQALVQAQLLQNAAAAAGIQIGPNGMLQIAPQQQQQPGGQLMLGPGQNVRSR